MKITVINRLRNGLLGLSIVLSGAAWSASPTYTFAIVPQQSAAELAKDWVPLLKRVSELSGVPLRFATAPDIPAFEKRLSEGAYDFAYMNPYHYTVFHASPGYAAMAKEKDRKIRGILVARKGGNVKVLEDLRGQSVAFPAPAAFAATVLPRAELQKSGIAVSAKYVSSHDSVYMSVARGLYPAGGGITRTLDMLEPALREQLEVVWTTKGYTPHAIAAHPRVDAEMAKKIQHALLAIHAQPGGDALLKAVGFTNGLMPARNEDWDDVRQLKIDELAGLKS